MRCCRCKNKVNSVYSFNYNICIKFLCIFIRCLWNLSYLQLFNKRNRITITHLMSLSIYYLADYNTYKFKWETWRFAWFLYILYRFVYTSSKSIFQSYLTLDKKVSTTTGSKTEQKERLLPSVLFVDAHSFWFNHERYTTNFLSI